MKTDIVGFTVCGRSREINGDTFLIDQELGFAAVADTVGIVEDGAVPSQVTVDCVHESLAADVEHGRRRWQYALRKAAANANAKLLSMSETRPNRGGATTLTCCLLRDNRAYFAHLGDSRAYLLRNNSIEQMTTDETLATVLVQSKLITPSDALTHPGRNQLMNALGIQSKMKPTTWARQLLEEDTIVLCTDGVSSVLADEKILVVVLEERGHFRSVARRLVHAALDNGAQDDATALVIRTSRHRKTARIPGGNHGNNVLDTA